MMTAPLDVETPLPISFHPPAMFRAALELGVLRELVSEYTAAGWHRGVRTLPLILEPGQTVIDRFDRSPALYVLIEQIRKAAGAGKVMRAFLSDLAAGGIIDDHRDTMPREGRRRFHAVLNTNAGALFTVAATTWHMAAGRVYEIDPTEPHSVSNTGRSHRTHLVIDCKRAGG